MSPQTETKASVGFKAGVKDYKLTYYTPEYETKDTDILAAFRVTPQPGVPPEEAQVEPGFVRMLENIAAIEWPAVENVARRIIDQKERNAVFNVGFRNQGNRVRDRIEREPGIAG